VSNQTSDMSSDERWWEPLLKTLTAEEWASRSYELVDTRSARQLLRSRRGWSVCDEAAKTLIGPMPEQAARLMFLTGRSRDDH
jgi:hypothetical protein